MQTRYLTIAVAIALSAAASTHAAETTDASTDAALSAQTLDTVSVIGQGETRQVQRITAVDKQVPPPGTSGQKILDRLPGVSVQSNDAFGANEESQTISLRGFDKSRLGYTLDGIPLGDNSYGNYNGLSIARAIIAENLAGAELSQGIGSLGVASTSNLGGTIQYSMDPSTEFGGRASVTVGDDSQRRGYLRVDTGDINGFSAYVSGVHQDQDMWAAPYQNQTTRQFNAKAVWNVGDHRFGAFVATSRASQANYAYLSKDMLARGLGWDWNIYAPDWDRAVAAAYCAPGTYNKARCKFSGGVNSIDDAYYQSRALRDDISIRSMPTFAWASRAPEAAGLPPRQPWPGPLVGTGPAILPGHRQDAADLDPQHQLHDQPRWPDRRIVVDGGHPRTGSRPVVRAERP